MGLSQTSMHAGADGWPAPVLVLALAGFFGLFCLHAWQYYPFIADDALISFRYAERLLNGQGLTWTEGRPVEGYSNLLWLLMVAFLGWLGADLIEASRILGLLAVGAILFALVRWHGQDEGGGKGWLPLLVGLVFFVAAAPVAVYSIGGMEQPLYAALLALAIPLTVRLIETEVPQTRTILWLSLLLGAMSLTRPDGPLFTVAALLAIYAGRRVTGKPALPWQGALLLLSLPILCYGGQTVFRLLYYGEWVANTALVKVSPSVYHFMEGLEYLLGGMSLLAPLSWLAVLLTLVLVFVRPALGLPLAFMGGFWAFYVCFIGGDVFRIYRHLLPLVVVFAFAFVGGLQWLSGRLQVWMRSATRPRPAVSLAAVLLLAALFVPYLHGQAQVLLTKDVPHNRWIWQWVWDCKITAELLKQAFHEQQPLVAVGAAGCIPYWSQLPSLDMYGLNDWYLPRHKPPEFGQRWIGHELGDGDYVIASKPDIIVWDSGTVPNDKAPRHHIIRSLRANPEFGRLYTPIYAIGRDPEQQGRRRTTYFLVRQQDSRIGITRSESEVRIPGYLFSGNPKNAAYLNRQAGLVAPVSAARPATLLVDSLAEAHSWQARVLADTDSAGIEAKLTRQGESLRVELTSQDEAVTEVREVILRRRAP